MRGGIRDARFASFDRSAQRARRVGYGVGAASAEQRHRLRPGCVGGPHLPGSFEGLAMRAQQPERRAQPLHDPHRQCHEVLLIFQRPAQKTRWTTGFRHREIAALRSQRHYRVIARSGATKQSRGHKSRSRRTERCVQLAIRDRILFPAQPCAFAGMTRKLRPTGHSFWVRR